MPSLFHCCTVKCFLDLTYAVKSQDIMHQVFTPKWTLSQVKPYVISVDKVRMGYDSDRLQLPETIVSSHKRPLLTQLGKVLCSWCRTPAPGDGEDLKKCCCKKCSSYSTVCCQLTKLLYTEAKKKCYLSMICYIYLYE